MTQLRALVCGLPGSGNRLVYRHLQRSGVYALLDHGDQEARWKETLSGHLDFAIFPIRYDEAARIRSSNRGGTFSNDPALMDVMWQRVYRLPISVYPVIFEEILETAGAALDVALRQAGVEPMAWPEGPSMVEHPDIGCVLTEAERRRLPGRYEDSQPVGP